MVYSTLRTTLFKNDVLFCLEDYNEICAKRLFLNQTVAIIIMNSVEYRT